MRLVGQLEADGVAAGDARPGDVHEARPLAEGFAVQLEPALERGELACGFASMVFEAYVSLELFREMSRRWRDPSEFTFSAPRVDLAVRRA